MKRYHVNDWMQSPTGDYVLFTDHQAALKELAAEVIPWVGALAVGAQEYDSVAVLFAKLKSLTEGPV